MCPFRFRTYLRDFNLSSIPPHQHKNIFKKCAQLKAATLYMDEHIFLLAGAVSKVRGLIQHFLHHEKAAATYSCSKIALHVTAAEHFLCRPSHKQI